MSQDVIRIEAYETISGKIPFREWFRKLDNTIKMIIFGFLELVTKNFGNSKSLFENIWELIFHLGPGYRIYYGKQKEEYIILLCAGDKGKQTSDIEHAKIYWTDYKNRGINYESKKSNKWDISEL